MQNELTLLVPNALVPGEPGDLLTPEFVALLNRLALAGLWPVDFGPSTASRTQVVLQQGTVAQAQAALAYFVACGGAV